MTTNYRPARFLSRVIVDEPRDGEALPYPVCPDCGADVVENVSVEAARPGYVEMRIAKPRCHDCGARLGLDQHGRIVASVLREVVGQ